MPYFSLEEIEDCEGEPADKEDGDHADQQPAGPAIASTSLSRSLSTLPLHPLDVCLQVNVGLVKRRDIERKKRNFYVLLILEMLISRVRIYFRHSIFSIIMKNFRAELR